MKRSNLPMRSLIDGNDDETDAVDDGADADEFHRGDDGVDY